MNVELQPIYKENGKIPTSAVVNPKDVVNSINKTIKNKHASAFFLFDYCTAFQLTEAEIITTLDIVNEASILSRQILDKLYKKNIFFAKSVDYFSEFARKNLDNVNHVTIDIVNNPAVDQLVKKLNKLAPRIKEYIMLRVRDEIALTYTMSFEHPQPLNCFDICPATHTLATHSRNKELYLYNLKTNSCIRSFPENDNLNQICFNADGSKMATVAHCTTFNKFYTSRIKIWNPPLEHLAHVITQKYFAYHVAFMKNKSNDMLAVFTKKPDKEKRILTLWEINQPVPTIIAKTCPLPWKEECLTIFDPINKKDYTCGFHPQSSSTVCVTKHNCHELHLCKQAIENNVRPETLANIYNSQAYHTLTACETTLVHKK